jgi:putative DNA primase/helicase
MEQEKWAVYAHGRWAMEARVTARSMVQEMVRGPMLSEAIHYSASDIDPDSPQRNPKSFRETFLAWAGKQQMTTRIDAALREAAGMSTLRASLTEFDQAPMLFNCANGVLDLATGKLIDHEPGQLLMRQSPVVFDPKAACPMFLEFLARVQPIPEVREYLRRVVGYTLTGHTSEQSIFLHHGQTGSNGKSVFLDTIAALMGTDNGYAQKVPHSALLLKRNDSHPTEIARMGGVRMLQASETKEGRSLDEEAVKELTGDKRITARFMGKDFFDFTATGKIHLATNHLPKISDANSIWRRIHLVGWRVTIADEDQDTELADKLIAAELPGILNWALEGCLAWQREKKLVMPANAQADKAEYRRDMDEFGEFEEIYVEKASGSVVTNEALFGAYRYWAVNSGLAKVMDRRALGRKMVERGYERTRGTGGARGFAGIRLTRNDVMVGKHDDHEGEV